MFYKIQRKGSSIFNTLLNNRKIFVYFYFTYMLSINDFRQRYQSTWLGIIWVVIQPLSYLIVIATVIHFGLRGQKDTQIPYFVFLASGYIPWLFFATTNNRLVSVFTRYSYIVKNIRIPFITLPMAVLLSCILVHFLILSVLLLILYFNGFIPNIIYLQAGYYFLACIILVFSIGMITSSLYIFFRDLEKIIQIIIQFGFWLTPILWDKEEIPGDMQWILRLNPMEYIVSGYRNTFIYQIEFYTTNWQIMYFWSFTLVTLFLGIFLFRRLTPYLIEFL